MNNDNHITDSVMSMTTADQLICPISLAEIKFAGITVNGSIYEYQEIVDWLKNNNTDPMTNLVLPTKNIEKYDLSISTKEQLFDAAKARKDNSIMYFNSLKLQLDAPDTYKKLKKLLFDQESDEWKAYSQAKIINFIPVYFCGNADNLDAEDEIKRPTGTGARFQFINLRDQTITDRGFKSEMFDFAKLSNCEFFECDFSRVSFIGTEFNNVTFYNCRFVGEQVCFYQATHKKLSFINCTMEHVNTWKTTNRPATIREILEDRLMQDVHKIIIA